MSIELVKFGSTSVEFGDYPFPPAAVFPNARLEYGRIREVRLLGAPPEIRTDTGEILFGAATQRRPLNQPVRRRSLPVVERVDVWHHILS